jgi:hypothetical protein
VSERELIELLSNLMECEHMGDVTRAVHVLGRRLGVLIEGSHGDWTTGDWEALEEAQAALNPEPGGES